MKKKLSILLFLFLVNVAYSQVSKTINVSSAGTLGSLLTSDERTTITNLTVTGNIDARDFKLMRDFIFNLSILDISAVKIQAYKGSEGPFGFSPTNTTYPANEIPASSFYNSNGSVSKTSLITILLPNSITSIGHGAFSGCSGITSIIIPNSVTLIGGYAFLNCFRIANLTIGSAVKTIAVEAFHNCSNLTELSIPNSVTTIEEQAFSNCIKLKSITIGNSVTLIGKAAFFECTSLTNAILPNSVTTIGELAFSYCSGLTSLSIPLSINSIGNSAFKSCTKLSAIYIYSITPIDLSYKIDVFANINKTSCILYVPTGSKILYQSAYLWKDFINIVEMNTPIQTIVDSKISISPNPFSDNFTVTGLTGISTIILSDFNGKTILSKQISTNEIISTYTLPKGIYIVKVLTRDGNVIRKVVKK